MRTKGAYNQSTYDEAARLKMTVEEYRRQKLLGNIKAGIVSQEEQPEVSVLPPLREETDEEIWVRIEKRHYVMESMVNAIFVDGAYKAVIIGGPAGLGKTAIVRKVTELHDPQGIRTKWMSGFTRTTGVYRALYEMKEEGNILVIDDCDAALRDPNAMNLFKAALDTSDKREIYYGAETKMRDDEGDKLPTSFEFNGTVIFITNMDLEALSKSGGPLARDYEALISRSHYIDCSMHSLKEYIIRIKQILAKGMLKNFTFKDKAAGFSIQEEEELLEYLEDNLEKFREVTLRVVLKLAEHYREYPKTWKTFAEATLFKSRR